LFAQTYQSRTGAAVFQLTYQIKILTTAIMSTLMLGRVLTTKQWLALLLLTVGVALVQLSQIKGDTDKKQDSDVDPTLQTQMVVKGITAVVVASCTSGFAGVYFEKILKNGPPISLWMRNVQLGGFSLVFGAFALMATSAGADVERNGFFYGFTPITWCAVLLQSVGGLMVAVLIKYADNIVKNFSNAVSLVLSSVLSSFLFGFDLSALFLFGALVVNIAIVWYSNAGAAAPIKSTVQQTNTPLMANEDGEVEMVEKA
jgi:UDP-sugar transporter A1/2/3